MESYDETAKAASISALVPKIVAVIRDGNIGSFIEYINTPKGLLAALSEENMSTLHEIYLLNPMFFDDALILIKDNLLSYRGGRMIPEVEEKLSKIRSYVINLLGHPAIDNAGRHRLEILLRELPEVGADRKEI